MLRACWFLALALAAGLACPRTGLAWGGASHAAITRAACQTLPPWQKELLGNQLAGLVHRYCLIPDQVYTDRENARFAMMDSRPGVRYILNLHLPGPPPENLEVLQYFVEKTVAALRAGRVADAARYMGTVCHLVEDYGSPAHVVPEDNMFTLWQQFLPPPEEMKGVLLHGPIENGTFQIDLKDYRPRLLGTSVPEASWRLLHRIHEQIVYVRATTVPIIRGLYAGDRKAVDAQQRKAARFDAQVVADALYTILCLGAKRFAPAEVEQLQRVEITRFFPLEAPKLYYPQSQFFGKPYWGYPRVGFTLAEGKRPVPLRLRLRRGKQIREQEIPNGISAGMGRRLTFLLPEGVFQRFEVTAGLHAQLGAQGKVQFTVLGDGKVLQRIVLSGSEPARRLECDIRRVTRLALALESKTSQSQYNYAIWAAPTLIKAQAAKGTP